ncbi:MAG: MMPL family transporter, partial [Dokdonella sp.]
MTTPPGRRHGRAVGLVPVWIVLAWIALLATLGFYAQHALHISTDLRSFMPPARSADQKLLLDQIGNGPGSRLLLLAIEKAPPDHAADLSRGLVAAISSDARFAQIANGALDDSLLSSDLLPYRYLLSPTLDQHALDAAYLTSELGERVADFGSPAASMLKPLLPRDPTLELVKLAQRWSPPKPPPMRGGVWMTEAGEPLLIAQTRAPGFDPDAQSAALAALQNAFHALPDVGAATLTISGPGAFTVAVSERTRGESEWIGRISTVGFIVLLLVAYRSFAVLLLAALPILSGALAGIGALALSFGEAHGITLAFGFTLLGVAQEYPIRLLSHRRAGETAIASIRALWPLLLTAITSACIAYLAFFASGVPGLQQLAVFTITGLLVAGLSTRYLLPHVLPQQFRDAEATPGIARAWNFLDRLPRPRWLPPLLLLIAAGMFWWAPPPFWQDNLAALTPVSQTDLQRDEHLRSALGAADVRYLLVLQADSANDVLDLSERMTPRLDKLVSDGVIDGIELPSRYLPSAEVQRERQAKLPDRSTLEAALAQAQTDLPFRAGLFEPFVVDVEAARALKPLTAAQFEKSPLGTRLAAMLVERDGRWLGLATLIGVHDVAALQKLDGETHGAVRLLDLKDASESLIKQYRARILRALAIAIGLLALTVFLAFRNLRRAWHVLAPMTLATILVLAVLRISGIPLSLFHLV